MHSERTTCECHAVIALNASGCKAGQHIGVRHVARPPAFERQASQYISAASNVLQAGYS
jgi:hypothetical protein